MLQPGSSYFSTGHWARNPLLFSQRYRFFCHSGFGSVTLTFDVGADMQQATLDVINNLNQAPPLPLDAIEPTVVAGGGQNAPNAASILIRPLPGNQVTDVVQFQQLIEDTVYPRLSRIQGVGQVNLNSQRPRELRITFDPQRATTMPTLLPCWMILMPPSLS